MINPMLARNGCLELDGRRVIAQPKLDGIRAVWDVEAQCLRTRNGRRITSLRHIERQIAAAGLGRLPLDGEIWTPELTFQRINALVRRRRGEAAHLALQFHIFDIVSDAPAHLRATQIDELGKAMDHAAALRIVASVSVRDNAHLHRLYAGYLEAGYEGMMLRDADAGYVQGRTAALRKIKPVRDAEAVLVGFKPGTTDLHRETFGALILEMDGRRFSCAGLSEQARREIWRRRPIGALVTVEFGDLTDTGLPRFPRFKAIRHDI